MKIIPIFIFLAAFAVSQANQVKLVQLRYNEACEEDGKGDIQVAIDVGQVLPQDKLQSYEIAVSYRGEGLQIQLPVLTNNTLTAQMPSQYRSFGVDVENREIFGSAAASISKIETGVYGSTLLIGFRVSENTDCDEPGELKITQFWVNEECTIDFQIDSTLTIEKRKSDKFISELTASSQISSLTLKDTNTVKLSVLKQMNLPRKVDYLNLRWSTVSDIKVNAKATAPSDSVFIEEGEITYWGLSSEADSLAEFTVSYIGDSKINDTLELNWELTVNQKCDCVEAIDQNESYSLIYEASDEDTSSVARWDYIEKNIFFYNEGLISDSYRGKLDIITVQGKVIHLSEFESGKTSLRPGVYFILTENRKIQKLIVNSF